MKLDVVVPVHRDFFQQPGQVHLLDVQWGSFELRRPVLDVLVVGGAGCDPDFLVLHFILTVEDFQIWYNFVETESMQHLALKSTEQNAVSDRGSKKDRSTVSGNSVAYYN